MERENDFSQGSIAKNILNLAVPMTLAQLINVLYSVVDRVYIGHLQGVSANALTGIGLALPIITIITAFANLFGMGGAPLCSIARGSHEEEKAEKVMGNSFSMLLFTGALLMGICFIFRKPLLYLFGASSATFPYANAYISIYLCGTVFVMISLGMNQFINSQGFGKIGMLTVMLGAFTNIVLDPDFRTGYGSTGSSSCNGDLPGIICSLGDEVSDREEGDSSTLKKSNASGVEACKRNHLSGNIGICDVCYKRDCMQCNAPEVRG